jgi:plastocyanin
MRRAALLGALVLSLAGAGDAVAAVVLIEPDGPDPDRVRIAPLGTVRWENATPTAQRVESIGEPDFDPVDVAAGGAGERRFNRPGRYRYRLAATGREGVVIVGAAARRPRARGRGCNRRDVYLYDVTVRALKAASEEWLPQYETTGIFSLSYASVARYRSVPVIVSRNCFGGLRVRGKGTGTGSVADYVWNDGFDSTDPSPTSGSEPCAFSEATSGLGAGLELQAGLERSGNWMITTESRLARGQFEALQDLLSAARDAVCDRGWLTNVRVFDGLAGHGTVPIFDRDYRVGPLRMQPPGLHLPGSFGWSGRRNPPPSVRALVRGRGFTVNSGQKRYHGTSSQTIADATASVTVNFTRRR